VDPVETPRPSPWPHLPFHSPVACQYVVLLEGLRHQSTQKGETWSQQGTYTAETAPSTSAGRMSRSKLAVLFRCRFLDTPSCRRALCLQTFPISSAVVAGKDFAFRHNLLCIIFTKFSDPKLTHNGDILSGCWSFRLFHVRNIQPILKKVIR
jgi:hypothetical protein